MQFNNSAILVTAQSTILATIGGRRTVGIYVFNTGPGALTGFEIWGRLTSGRPISVGAYSAPGEPWAIQSQDPAVFSAPSELLKGISSATNPTSLAANTGWSATLDLQYLSDVQIRATSASTSAIVLEIGG